jgi:hypothetical protein
LTAVGLHYGKGGGDFQAQVVLVQDASKSFSDAAIADLTGDGVPDVVVAEQKTSSVRLYRGKGARQFDSPQTLKVNSAPVSLALADLDGDGLLDITSSNTTSQSVSITLNRGANGFAEQVGHRLGFSPLGHRLADLDNDGALDLVAFGASSAMTLLGRPQGPAGGSFLRGDANGDLSLDVSDAIQILFVLFRGRFTDCKDALDANDDGKLDTTDAIRILDYLFRSGPEPAPPFPIPGPDPTGDDTLDCHRS